MPPPFPLTPTSAAGDPFCTDPYCDPPQEGNSITVCSTFVPPFEIDGGTAPLALNVQGLEASVTSVEVTISFTKPGRFGGYPPAFFTYNSEIFFYLYSPEDNFDPETFYSDGPGMYILYDGSITGQYAETVSGTLTFGDQYAAPYDADSVISGNYQPGDPFSIFNGQSGNGIWYLLVGDNSPPDPLLINSCCITVSSL